MFYQYGLFKPLVNRKIGKVTTVRQLAPVSLVILLLSLCAIGLIVPFVPLIGVLTILITYFAATLYSIRNYQEGRARIYMHLVYCVILTHLSYGIGYLEGLLFGVSNNKITLSR